MYSFTIRIIASILSAFFIAGRYIDLSAQEGGGRAVKPTLMADFHFDIITDNDVTMNAETRLYIEHNVVREIYPFLPYIFFEAGSATVPERYTLFGDSLQTSTFDVNSIPGGTLQKYYQTLNILGERLRKHPEASIEITGCNSLRRELAETRELSAKRAEGVRDYLVDVWRIDPKRVRMVRPRDLPEHPSPPGDPKGCEENRRVEIRSRSWEIMRPIEQVDVRRYPIPDTMRFRMRNNIDDDKIASREIEIRRGGGMWHRIVNIGISDSVSPSYNFGRDGNEDSIPVDEHPYVAQFVVHTRNGDILRSDSVEIPVVIMTKERKIASGMIAHTIDRYCVNLFDFNSALLDAINDSIVHLIICDSLNKGAKTKVVGYDDGMLSEQRSMRLSEQRAATIANAIRRYAKGKKIDSIERKGVGGTEPFYTNELPEGRCLNRTVQLIIWTPWGERPWR
jgi:outer membrane protein OmpA-like peptidoglycan-associated protein